MTAETPPAAPPLPFWLHSRYLLGGVVAAATLLTAAAVGFLAYERGELQRDALVRSELFVRVLEDQANRTFNGVELALDTAAETLRLQRSQGDLKQLSPLLQQAMQALPFLRSISLLGRDGLVLASSAPANVGHRIDRQRLPSKWSIAGLGPLLLGRDLTDLRASAATGLAGAESRYSPRLLPLVRPRPPQTDGEWLVATLNPAYFANQYALLLDETPLRASLLSYSGQLLVPAASSTRLAGEWLSGHPLFSAALRAGREKGSLQGTGIDSDRVISAYRTARHQPLVLLVETPERVVQAEFAGLVLNVGAGTAVLLLLLGALGFMAWRSLRSHEAVRSDLQATRGTLAAHDAVTDRLFQLSPIPMVVKDAGGRFLRVNRAWTEFTGIAPQRAIGSALEQLTTAPAAAPHLVQELLAMRSGQPVSYEAQMPDSARLQRDVMVRVTPFTGTDGRVDGVIACLTDVTEFREAALRTLEAKESAERASVAKGEFLANISHELRTPLQSILGFSELGLSRAAADARLLSMFSSVHLAGERMLRLVNDLLDLSRLESTVGEIALQLQDIVPLLRAVVDELQGLALARRLRLDTPVSQAPLQSHVDAARLQQVLRNVRANAIRFAPAGSAITLTWGEQPSGQRLVSVRDHGPGIPPGEFESIFEAFVQSSRTKDGAGGTGLGLAICRQIMAGHRGSIRARNHAEGDAVFDLRLPAPAGAAVEPPPGEGTLA